MNKNCDICSGTGEYEEVEYESNDTTGYNNIIHDTGRVKPCPECD